MRAHLVHAQLAQVVHGRAQAHGLGGGRGAGLELVGQLVPGRALALDARDHVPAAQERRHLLQQLPAAVEQADGGAERLVAGPGVEVGVDRAQVDGHLGHGLRAVDQADRAGRPGAPHDLGHRVDRAQDVGHVRHRHELHAALAEHGVELVQRELGPVGHRQVAQARAGGLAQELPGHDVGVVLHLGDEHLVALAHLLAAPGVGHEVDGLGGVAGEDRAGRIPVHEGGDPLAGGLEGLGRLTGQLVDAAVDGGVGLPLEAVHRGDHRLGALRGGRRVEVGHAPAAELAREHREVGAHVDQRLLGDRAHQDASARSPMNSRTCSSAPCSFSATRRRTRSSRPGSSSRWTTSSK